MGETKGVQRYCISMGAVICPGDNGLWVKVADHEAALAAVKQDADDWATAALAAERREAECEELAELIRGAAAWCQEQVEAAITLHDYGIKCDDRDATLVHGEAANCFRSAAVYLRNLQVGSTEGCDGTGYLGSGPSWRSPACPGCPSCQPEEGES